MVRRSPRFVRAFHPFFFAVSLVAVVGLGGCRSRGSEGKGKILLRYARWGLPEEITAERELLKTFEARNPDLQVKVEFSSWGEYWNKLQAQMAAGTAPDVFLIGGTYVHDYAALGQLVDLTPYIKGNDGIDLGAYFKPTVDIYDFDGGIWALPRDCNTVAIYYNKSLFDKYGVSYPKPDWNWDDFLEKARRLTVDENGDGRMESYGFLASFESMEVNWGGWVWQNGGEILNRDHTQCLLNRPRAVEALKFYSDLVLKEKVSPDTAQASTFGSNMFLTGRLAMSSEGSWMLRAFSQIERFQWDVAPMPKGRIQVAPVNGLGNAVYAKTKNMDAAWRLAKFLSSKECQEKLAQSGTSIPALRSVAYSPVYLDGNPAGKHFFLEQIEKGRSQDFTRGFAKWDSAIRSQLERVWLGEKPVAAALDEATTQVNAILKEGSGTP